MTADTIILGDHTFTISAFTFDQLQALLEVFDEARKPLNQGGFEACRRILAAALGDQIGPEDFAGLRATLPQVVAAVRKIGFVSGIYLPGEPPPAETDG